LAEGLKVPCCVSSAMAAVAVGSSTGEVEESECAQDITRRQLRTNAVPLRPAHYVLRPEEDPRLDNAIYIRYDPFPEVKTGTIVIVVPGGNYDDCDIRGGEGQPVAQWLVLNGITAVVLQYRCVSRGFYWPAQFEDWTACAQAVRSQATSWGCDPESVGVIGFSAGGHLAGYAALKAPLEIQPKFQMLLYPAINAMSPDEASAWRADQGYPAEEESIHTIFQELGYLPSVPPTFMACSTADDLCPVDQNTDLYHELLIGAGVPCEYVRGTEDITQDGHGCGLKAWWTLPCEDWLRERGWAAALG